MAFVSSKKHKLEDASKARVPRPYKKSRKQQNYSNGSSSPSADEFDPVDLADSDTSLAPLSSTFESRQTANGSALSSSISASDSEVSISSRSRDESATRSQTKNKARKRNDPNAFALSLHTILSAKVPTAKRSDPVLARSRTALEASHSVVDNKLEQRARRALRDEKRKSKEKGRIKDVLLGERATLDSGSFLQHADATSELAEVGNEDTGTVLNGQSAAEILLQERQLRKTAQRGVVKLFNAVRAAQVKAEETERELRNKGVIGVKRRQEKVGEMSQRGFLELVAGGGKE